MARVKSFNVYSFFPHYSDPSARPLEAKHGKRPDLALPHCVLLRPTSAAVDAAGVALLTQVEEEIPRRNRVSVLATELPDPSSFGEFDTYEAVLFEPGVVSFVVALHPVSDGSWAGSLGEISLPFSPAMRVIVRPANSGTGASTHFILAGDVGGERLVD